MTDYNELVKALRSASTVSTAWEKLMHDAAAAIEELDAEETRLLLITSELQDKVVELEEELNDADIAADDNARQVEELQAQLPKRGEWVVKGANRIDCSVCGHSVCFAFGLSDGSFDLYKYCPECGAKMEVQDG